MYLSRRSINKAHFFVWLISCWTYFEKNRIWSICTLLNYFICKFIDELGFLEQLHLVNTGHCKLNLNLDLWHCCFSEHSKDVTQNFETPQVCKVNEDDFFAKRFGIEYKWFLVVQNWTTNFWFLHCIGLKYQISESGLFIILYPNIISLAAVGEFFS